MRPARMGAPKKISAKRGYHHGDLRAALLEAAREVLAKEGVEALTLREVARRAGVTHAAPYRHFADKEALLAAVATEGYLALTQSMEAHVKPKKDPVQRLLAAGAGYVAFALAHPAHYRLMFGPGIQDFEAHPPLKAASDAAFGYLVERISQAQAAGGTRQGDTLGYAAAAWSMSHGLALGLLDGMFEGAVEVGEKGELEFAQRALLKLMHGFVLER